MDIIAQIDALDEMIRSGDTGRTRLRVAKIRVAIQKLMDDATQARVREKMPRILRAKKKAQRGRGLFTERFLAVPSPRSACRFACRCRSLLGLSLHRSATRADGWDCLIVR
jgi:hypothetical protein